MPVSKIPLADRLRKAAAKENRMPYLHIFRLYVDSYFCNLDILFGGTAYYDTMAVVLRSHLKEYEQMPMLTRFVADSRKLSAEDQRQVLYQVLIRPFAEIQKEKERMDRECLSLPF